VDHRPVRDADQPGWAAPDERELRQHLADQLLDLVPPAEFVSSVAQIVAELREDLVVVRQEPLRAHVRLLRLEYLATVEAEPPYRLTMLRGAPVSGPISDARVAAPAPRAAMGDVPAEMTSAGTSARDLRRYMGGTRKVHRIRTRRITRWLDWAAEVDAGFM
jgi:hypothetical protein